MAMKLTTLVKIIGDLGVELQHSMAEAAHARFLTLFEDPRQMDGTYTPQIG